MVAAVIEADLEVHDRAAGDEAAGRAFLNALVDGGDVVARDGAADDGVFEHVAGTARQAFHFDPAVAELAASAALLLMAALHLYLAANGFTVGDLGRLEQDFHLVAAFGALDGGFDVELAHARKQDVAGFLVAAQLQGHVLIQQLLDGGVHLVFVALFLRREGESDELRGELRHGDREGGLVVAERVARAGIFQLAHRNDRAGAEHILAGRLRFAVKIEEGAEAFGFLGTHVLERRFGADGAGDHAHHVELAGERVRNGLEDEAASRAFVAGGAFVAVGVEEGRTFERRGEEAGDGVEQFAPALVFERGAHHDRDKAGVEHALAQAGGDVFFGKGTFLKVFLHQLFVGLGDVFDGGVVQERRFVRDGVGDEGFGHGTVFAEHKGLAAEDVHDAR